MKKKPIVISMGEPSGISSEILIKTWINRKKKNLLPFFVVDDKSKIEFVINLFKFDAKVKLIKNPNETFDIFNNYLPVYDLGNKIKFKLGQPEKKNSKFIIDSLNKSFNFVKNKQASALVTLPICKRTMKQFGFNYNGQTEYVGFLARKLINRSSNEIMILTTTKPIDSGKNLVIGLATTHIPLKKVHQNISKRKIVNHVEKIHKFYKKNLKKIPHIGLTGLNPHCESYSNTNEEDKIIKPAINFLLKKNYKISGPFSADTIFLKKNLKKFDVIIGMYHDQVLTPMKTLFEYDAINITLGLPFTRISPDHGPNEKMLGKNKSDPKSLIQAINFLDKN